MGNKGHTFAGHSTAFFDKKGNMRDIDIEKQTTQIRIDREQKNKREGKSKRKQLANKWTDMETWGRGEFEVERQRERDEKMQ